MWIPLPVNPSDSLIPWPDCSCLLKVALDIHLAKMIMSCGGNITSTSRNVTSQFKNISKCLLTDKFSEPIKD